MLAAVCRRLPPHPKGPLLCRLVRLASVARRGRCMCTAAAQATVSGTASFFAKQSSAAAGVRMPRTGLTLSRLVYGGDDVGMPVTARAQALMAVLKSGMTNTVQFPITEVANRNMADSPLYSREEASRFWEVRAGAPPGVCPAQ